MYAKEKRKTYVNLRGYINFNIFFSGGSRKVIELLSSLSVQIRTNTSLFEKNTFDREREREREPVPIGRKERRKNSFEPHDLFHGICSPRSVKMAATKGLDSWYLFSDSIRVSWCASGCVPKLDFFLGGNVGHLRPRSISITVRENTRLGRGVHGPLLFPLALN